MSEFTAKTVMVSATMRFDFPVEDIWPLLCPVREYDWIEVWDCEMIHSESGVNELGCVFRTNSPTEGGVDTWMTCRYDPMERIEFMRTNDTRIIHFIIDVKSKDQKTQLTWTQHVIALNETGNTYIENKRSAYAIQMKMLEKMLNHYLKTGEALPLGELLPKEEISTHEHSRKTG